jgi:hypothetical protein
MSKFVKLITDLPFYCLFTFLSIYFFSCIFIYAYNTIFFLQKRRYADSCTINVTTGEIPCLEPSLFRKNCISLKVLEYSIRCNVAGDGAIGWNLELGNVPRINSQSETLQLRIASVRDLAS